MRLPRREVRFTTHPLLAERLPEWRSRLLVLLLSAGFLGLAVRAFWIQGPASDFYVEQGRRRVERDIALPATRGKILDRNGRILALSLPVRAIWANPEELPDDLEPQRLSALAGALELSVDTLQRRLGSARTFVYLKRQVDPQIAERISQMAIPGIHQLHESRRFYPDGAVAAHVVGVTDVESVGQEGIELTQDAVLSGVSGRRMVIRDRLGQAVQAVGATEPPHNGADLTLTIDSRIQHFAFNELRAAIDTHQAKAGAAVVLDAQTGEILALANWPAFDPNERAQRGSSAMRNRVLTDTFEPGSVIKPATVALALEAGIVTPDTRIDTHPGRISLGGRTIHDTSDHGVLSVAEIVQKSSNVGMVKLSRDLPAEDMWDMFQKLGLGRPPIIALPGAAAGRLRPFKSWRPIEKATMSYGYGLSTSLVQVAQMYTTFAGTGAFVPVSILRHPDISPDARKIRVIEPQTAAALRSMLELATAPGGTAQSGNVEGYRVGAKTGTAWKYDAQRGYAAGKERKYRAVFVGMAPISQPRVIVAVMIDEPSAGKIYGGTVAGPVFAHIMSDALHTLEVPPDALAEQPAAAAAGELKS